MSPQAPDRAGRPLIENIGQSLQILLEQVNGLRMQFNDIRIGFSRGEFGLDPGKFLSGGH